MPNHSTRQALQTLASAVAVVALFPALSVEAQSVQTEKGARHVVIIKQMHFDPSQLTIQSGQTVEWKNEDIFSHTVTADDGSFDSGLVAPGGSWQMKVKRVGKIGYHCRPHPNMTATLIVQAAAEEQATASNAAMPGGNQLLPGSNGRRTQRRSSFTRSCQFHGRAISVGSVKRHPRPESSIARPSTIQHGGMVLYAAVLTPLTAAAGWWWKLSAGSALPAKLITVYPMVGGPVRFKHN